MDTHVCVPVHVTHATLSHIDERASISIFLMFDNNKEIEREWEKHRKEATRNKKKETVGNQTRSIPLSENNEKSKRNERRQRTDEQVNVRGIERWKT